MSTTPGAFVTRREWLVLPVEGERPERGWEDRRVECPACGRALTLRVSSLARARRRQKVLRWASVAWLAVAVLCGLSMAFAGGGLLLLVQFGLVLGLTLAFTLYMRLGVEDGVSVRWPTLTRMRGHMLRWPPGTPRRWQP
ncbi:hypothetical protein E1264_21890 [Actinomadura sp. KC216]|uniref:hypothetical protein n=1 Tax=Actinomadura sp. KC216 TaxID=2530370 RepID=UPI00105191A6|nr:hypothetical protein [Actinomadura sp. KC216]TDB85249.1 hypothetical protein E1264_21890 [Actinomadura sp. KC216]